MAKQTRKQAQLKLTEQRLQAARKAAQRKRQRQIWVAVSVLVTLVLVLWLYTQRPGSLTGRVLDATRGEPLRGAVLMLDGRKQIQGELTSAFGFDNIRPGKHELQISAEGYKSQLSTFDLRPGEALRLEFSLNPVERQASLSGKRWVMGASEPPSISLLGTDLKEQKTIRLGGRPVSALVLDTTAYLADLSGSTIQMVDLVSGNVKKLELPVNAAPAKLLPGASANQVMILNTVGKEIAILNRESGKLDPAPIPLTFAPRDMFRTNNGSLLVLGPEILAVVSPGTRQVEKFFALPGVYANQMSYLASQNLLAVTDGRNLMRINPDTGSTETLPLTEPVELVEFLSASRVALAMKRDLRVFDLDLKQTQATRQFEGEIKALRKEGEQLLVLTSSPNNFYLLDAQTLEPRQQGPVRGTPAFGFTQEF